MKFKETTKLRASRERVAEMLFRPEVLQSCLEGCETLERIGDDLYEARLSVGIAGLKGTYTGRVQLTDKMLPESYTMIVEGKGAAGFLKGTARVRLIALTPGTEVQCEVDVHAGGVLVAVGSRLIEPFAKRMMADFFRKLDDQIAAAEKSRS